LDEIVRRLVKDFHPRRIFLFGSRAKGEAESNSDYDLLVIVPSDDIPGYRLAQRAHRTTFQGIPAPIDVVMISAKEFEAKKSVIGTLSETAVTEGQELYAA